MHNKRTNRPNAADRLVVSFPPETPDEERLTLCTLALTLWAINDSAAELGHRTFGVPAYSLRKQGRPSTGLLVMN